MNGIEIVAANRNMRPRGSSWTPKARVRTKTGPQGPHNKNKDTVGLDYNENLRFEVALRG